jgi:hypothetical protein
MLIEYGMFTGHHDTEFSRNKEYYFNVNTLSNAAKHLIQVHFLEEQGDI